MSRPIKHGAIRFWKRGIVPQNMNGAVKIIDALIAEYTNELGGQEELTSGQSVILNQLRRCLVFQAIADQWLSQPGLKIISNAGRIPPMLDAFYLSVMNSSVRFCRELGLKRVSEQGKWSKVLAAREATLATEGKGKASTYDAEEIAPHGGTGA